MALLPDADGADGRRAHAVARRAWRRVPALVAVRHAVSVSSGALPHAGAAAAPVAAACPGRRVGVPLSSATRRTAPWEAATALLALLDEHDDVRVELLAADAGVLPMLRDHPVLVHQRVVVLGPAPLDAAQLQRWVARQHVVLLPERRSCDPRWLSLCERVGTVTVGVGSAPPPIAPPVDPSAVPPTVSRDVSPTELPGRSTSVSPRTPTVSYPAGPTGGVDVDDVVAGLRAGLADASTRRRRVVHRLVDERFPAHHALYGRQVRRRGRDRSA